MAIQKNQIQEFLVDSGLITNAEYDLAYEESQRGNGKLTPSQILVNKGKISENDFRRAEAYVLGISFVSLKDQKIEASVLSLIPEPVSRKNNIIAYKRSADTLEVAVLDIKDLTAINFIKNKIGLKILARLTDAESIKSALLQYQKILRSEFGDIIQKDSLALKKIIENRGGVNNSKDLVDIVQDLSLSRVLDTILSHAIMQDVFDLHIEPREDSLLIRYRIDGIIYDAMVLPKEISSSLVARIKVLSNLKIDEANLPQEGEFNDQKGSFKVSVLPTCCGEKVVVRLPKESSLGFTLEGLGFHGEALDSIYEAIKEKKGLILVTGPENSGKTATLYTLLDILNSPNLNISTIEDPIELQIKRINQTQIKPEIGFDFKAGLRSLVSQDADVIMVGNITDSSTADLIAKTAINKHLVLTTLTQDGGATGAIAKMAEMNIDTAVTTSITKIIICQKRVRRLCSNKQEYFLSKTDVVSLSKVVNLDLVIASLKKEKIISEKETIFTIPFYKPKSSAECKDGYNGTVNICEVLEITDLIKDLIYRNESAGVINNQAKKQGMMSLMEDCIFKAAQGVTSIDEVLLDNQ